MPHGPVFNIYILLDTRENEGSISSKRLNLTNPQLSVSSLSSPSPSPASSPTVIHRKYDIMITN